MVWKYSNMPPVTEGASVSPWNSYYCLNSVGNCLKNMCLGLSDWMLFGCLFFGLFILVGADSTNESDSSSSDLALLFVICVGFLILCGLIYHYCTKNNPTSISHQKTNKKQTGEKKEAEKESNDETEKEEKPKKEKPKKEMPKEEDAKVEKEANESVDMKEKEDDEKRQKEKRAKLDADFDKLVKNMSQEAQRNLAMKEAANQTKATADQKKDEHKKDEHKKDEHKKDEHKKDEDKPTTSGAQTKPEESGYTSVYSCPSHLPFEEKKQK